jgi:hypothetical protein
MKPWRKDEEAVSRLLRGTRRRVRRSADVTAGRYRLDVRRRRRFGPLRWLSALEDANDGDHCAVVVHCADADRWLVILSLDEWRAVARACGLLPD